MWCVICRRYSAHVSDVNLRKFRVDGTYYLYPVCKDSYDGRFKAHSDAQEKIEEIVSNEKERQKQIEDQLKQRAEEIPEKQEIDSKANQERPAREAEERLYNKAMGIFST